MTTNPVLDLLARIERLEQGLAARNQPQLAHASVEDGAIEHYDETGQLTAIVGKQHDDTVAPVVVTGPTPPAPTGLDVTPGQLQVSASWAGTFDGDGVAPMDFSRVEVHRGTTEDFIPDTLPSSATRVGTIESPGGGSFTWSEEPGDIWVTLVTRSLSGKVSDHAELVQVTVMPAVDREEFVQAAKDIADAKGRLDTAASDLASAKHDLYDAGGRVDQVKTTLTGQIAAGDAALDSKGTDLVVNGTGTLGDNTNFSTMTFVADAPQGASGSFAVEGASQTRFSDRLIPVDPAKRYMLSASVKDLNSVKGGHAYFGYAPFDSAGLMILPAHYCYYATTMTTLAQPLTAGQTTFQLASAAGWPATLPSPRNVVGFWNWTDSRGRTWPPGTYTRNTADVTGISGTTVTLKSPYAGPDLPAGTPVSNNAYGATYIYTTMGNVAPTSAWTRYSSPVITGTADASTAASSSGPFPQGTAYVKLLILANRDVTGARHAFGGISMSDTTAAQTTATAAQTAASQAVAAANAASTKADAAQTSASGKNAISWSTSAAPASASGTRAGDIWNQYTLTNNAMKIIATWTSDGTTWQPSTLAETYLPQVNIGTGTYGEIEGFRLKANSVQADNVLVEGSVGRTLIADGAITSDKADINDLAAATGAIMSLDVGQLTVTDKSTFNKAVAQQMFVDIFAANKVTANEINAGSLAAAVLSVQNATITSRLLIAEGGEIVSSDPNGPHATLNSDGFCLYAQADDGTVYPSSRFTRDGATIEIFDDPTKPPTAAIGRDGAGSFSSVASDADMTISGKPLLGTLLDDKSDPGWMDGQPWGVVAQDSFQRYVTGKTLVGGATEVVSPIVMASALVWPNRSYEFGMPIGYYVGSSSATDISMGASVMVTFGADGNIVPPDPTVTSSTLARAKRSYSKTYTDPQTDLVTGVFTSPSTNTGPVFMKMLICATAKNATMTYSLPSTTTWGFSVKDTGPVIPGTAYAVGGTVKSTFTSVWRADFNRSFDKTGTDSPADYQQGILRHGGDAMTHSAFTCGGKAYSGETDKTIAQALNGASVSKVEIGLLSLYWVNSDGGTVSILPLNATTIGTTDTNPGDPKNGPHVEKQYTARSQWQWIEVPTSWIGPNSTGVRIGPTWFQGPNNQGYFANHKHPSAPPQVRITYTR